MSDSNSAGAKDGAGPAAEKEHGTNHGNGGDDYLAPPRRVEPDTSGKAAPLFLRQSTLGMFPGLTGACGDDDEDEDDDEDDKRDGFLVATPSPPSTIRRKHSLFDPFTRQKSINGGLGSPPLSRSSSAGDMDQFNPDVFDDADSHNLPAAPMLPRRAQIRAATRALVDDEDGEDDGDAGDKDEEDGDGDGDEEEEEGEEDAEDVADNAETGGAQQAPGTANRKGRKGAAKRTRTGDAEERGDDADGAVAMPPRPKQVSRRESWKDPMVSDSWRVF